MSHKTKKLLRKLDDMSRPLSDVDRKKIERRLAAFNAAQANAAKIEDRQRRKAGFKPKPAQNWRVNEPVVVLKPLRTIALEHEMEDVNQLIESGINGNMPKHMLDRLARKKG